MRKERLWLMVFVMTPFYVLGDEKEPDSVQLEFFESKIRPVLVSSCYPCHNSTDTAEGGLVLDYQAGLKQGGQSGPIVDTKAPGKSLLLKVLRHEIEGLEMPAGADPLSKESQADFETWIRMGAPDPRTEPPVATTNSGQLTWPQILEKRKQWWSFQPITEPQVPSLQDESWSAHPVDQFLQSKWEEAGLRPAPDADRRTLIRRLSYVLHGLPPAQNDIEEFLNDTQPRAFERLVDRFLAAPAFGEHWARHWMDLVRYAESHGSEGDPEIPHAWKYRDYLIRAFNQDVSYDQLIREHVAGDLLQQPRLNSELGLNESAIGTAHWRMCFHGFAPTDALDEKVRFTDDQINVFSKTFLGLTVSCARCHNHKFDPISQADYYAMFGIIGSTRPGIIDISLPEKQIQNQQELSGIKGEIRQMVASLWLEQLVNLRGEIERLANELEETSNLEIHLLYPFQILTSAPGTFAQLWQPTEKRQPQQRPAEMIRWDLSNPNDFEQWYVHGNGTAHYSALPGEFTTSHDSQPIGPLLPAGVYSHLLSAKHRNVFSSPDILLDGDYELWLRVAGDSQAMVRYVVQNYPRSGTVYPVTSLNDGQWRWQRYDLSYWNGDRIHIELTTAADTAVLAKDVEQSWFGIQEAVLAPKGTFQPSAEMPAYAAVFEFSPEMVPQNQRELADLYVRSLQIAIQAWGKDLASNSQIRLIQAARDLGLIQRSTPLPTKLQKALDHYYELEQAIASANRIAGLLEAEVADQQLFIRGNHRQPGATIPRRFLEVIDATPYDTRESGRLQLADDLLRDDNPLTSRVFVNRVWHYVFGAGLVRTVDNFGQLGELPSHPELLDSLAVRVRQQGWSTKSLIRELLLTRAWRLDSKSSPEAQLLDPDNRLLSHANLRRLNGEMLRDSLLAVSGRLDNTMFGPPVGNSNTHPRRSIYLSVRRNSINPFLETFDFPVPFATKGRRDSTNVPAQSLTLLNDPFVIESAKAFAQRTVEDSDSDGRITSLFEYALGRPPEVDELHSARSFVTQLRTQYEVDARHRDALQQQLVTHRQSVEEILAPVRERLLNERGQGDSDNEVQVSFAPLAEWRFDGSYADEIGNLHGEAGGNARMEDGALILDGSSYVKTAPLQVDLVAKTFEVIVQLENLAQQGGGVMTVQDLSGTNFDAVVFGEQQAGYWLAGSDHFNRTLPFQGTAEREALNQPVHLALTYAADGTIRAYRNGEPYGQPVRKAEPFTFKAKKAQVLFGLRHGNPGGNRLFSGRIFAARLYNRDLDADEVKALATGNTNWVSQRDVLAALTPAQSAQLAINRQRVEELKTQIEDAGPEAVAEQEWVDLAHAIFNFKEFLYFR